MDVTIGSSTNAGILNEENLASVALGKGASLNTTSEDLSELTSVALATGTADDRTTWTHSSGIAVDGDVSVGNHADITADSIDFGGADLKIGGTATLTSETGDVTLGGVAGLEDGVLATATVNSDIVVDEGVSVTLSQGEIAAANTTLKDDSTFELLGNNNVLGGTTGTPEENPYDLSEVTLGNDATLVIGGNNPAEKTEFYETFAKAASVKNASADAVGTIEVNGKLAADETAEDKVSVFTAGTVGDATNGGVNTRRHGRGQRRRRHLRRRAERHGRQAHRAGRGRHEEERHLRHREQYCRRKHRVHGGRTPRDGSRRERRRGRRRALGKRRPQRRE